MPAPPQLAHYRSALGYRAVQDWTRAEHARLTVRTESLQIQTRHGETFTLAAGRPDSQPVVLLHPLSANGMVWAPHLDALAGHYRLYVPDIIGMAGRSAPNRPAYSGPGYGDWLLDLLDGLGLESPALVGLAFGGWVALKLACQSPERVGRAALLAPAGLLPVRRSYMLRLLPRLLFLNPQRARRLAREMLVPEKLVPDDGFLLDDSLVEFLTLVLLHFKSPFEAPALAARDLRRVRAPTLVVVGEHEDVWDPVEMVNRARQSLPGLVAAEIVEGAGHALNASHPEWVNQRLVQFLGLAKAAHT